MHIFSYLGMPCLRPQEGDPLLVGRGGHPRDPGLHADRVVPGQRLRLALPGAGVHGLPQDDVLPLWLSKVAGHVDAVRTYAQDQGGGDVCSIELNVKDRFISFTYA